MTPSRSTHVQPGDISHALIQQGGGRGWGGAPTTTRRHGGGGAARYSGRASPKHRGGGRREVGLHHERERSNLVSKSPKPRVYIGGGTLRAALALPPRWRGSAE